MAVLDRRSLPSETGTLGISEILTMLQNDRRRAAIEAVATANCPMDVRDLSERIAKREACEDPAPRNVRESVYISLIQTHLPKLAQQGVISYNDRRKTVTEGEAFGDVLAVARRLQSPRQAAKWPWGDALVVGVSAVAIVLYYIDVWVFAMLRTAEWGLLGLSIVGLISVIHFCVEWLHSH